MTISKGECPNCGKTIPVDEYVSYLEKCISCADPGEVTINDNT